MELLRRKIDKYLHDWKMAPTRKPLIVKGARQIGKTESIRAFGRAHYDSVIEINFVLQKKFVTIFNDGYDVATIIKNISLLEPSWQLIPHKTLHFSMSCRNAPTVPQRSNPSARTGVTTSSVRVRSWASITRK